MGAAAGRSYSHASGAAYALWRIPGFAKRSVSAGSESSTWQSLELDGLYPEHFELDTWPGSVGAAEASGFDVVSLT